MLLQIINKFLLQHFSTMWVQENLLKVRALNVLAPDSTEHLTLALESRHTPGHHCKAQPLILIGGLLISCMIYCRTYGCRQVLGSLYPHPSIWNKPKQCSVINSLPQAIQAYMVPTSDLKENFQVNGLDARLPALHPRTRKTHIWSMRIECSDV